MAGSSLAAPHPTIANLYPMVTDSFHTNLILFAYCTGTPDVTANVFEHGAMMVQIDSGTGNKAIYENVGSSAVPSWNLIGSIIASEITLAEGKMLRGSSTGTSEALGYYGTVASSLISSTTPVTIFTAPTGFKGSLTSIQVVSLDDLNGTVSVRTDGGVAASIAKGSNNSVRGSSVLAAAAAFSATGSITAVNSASSNAIVIATFTTGV